jgi:outer membrane protein OmpA-like peptidoglycan-associated protein
LGLALAAWCAQGGMAQAEPVAELKEISRLLDSGRVVEAPVFAPKTWDQAQTAYTKARALNDKGGAIQELSKQLSTAVELARKAIAVTARTQQELAASLAPRAHAREARAQFVVPLEYGRAEDQWQNATRKIESGNLQGGQVEAGKALPLFDAAELAALHKTVLETCDSLLTQGEAEGADRYAPTTWALAIAHRERAYELIVADRHDRSEAVNEASFAEYEARHAMQLAATISDLNRSHATWEQVLLGVEADTRKVAKAAGLNGPAFDHGQGAATDSVIAQLESLVADLKAAGSELDEVSTVLSKALAETGESSPSTHPVELATQAGERLARLTEEKGDWARMAKARQAQLAEVSQLADETAFELAQRREREEKFKSAQNALTVSEGTVLYNDSSDIVLRLTGLSFAPGSSDLTAEHQKLLAKVESILKDFAGHRLVVEGHTDARGSKSGNLELSQKRAQAVSDFLVKGLSLDPEYILARGYGDEHPVASNSLAEGRAKNRRIDVVILQ